MRFVVELEAGGVPDRVETAQDPTTAEASGLGLCVQAVATGWSSNRTNTMLTAGRPGFWPDSKRIPHQHTAKHTATKT